jgi:hypothetical protein
LDLFDPDNALEPWPALHHDADVLEGQVLGLETTAGTVTGFLVSVEGEEGNVTLKKLDGELVTVDGSEVDRVKRRAYVGIVRTDVHIHRTLLKDVYVTVVSARPSAEGVWEATVMVREVPVMTVLWTGMGLMALGVVLRPLENYGERHMDEEGEGRAGSEEGEGPDDGPDEEESEEDED